MTLTATLGQFISGPLISAFLKLPCQQCKKYVKNKSIKYELKNEKIKYSLLVARYV